MTYTYDANGNLMTDGVNNYTYNYANRMKTYTDGVSTYAYTYNGRGDRLQQTVNGVTTTYTLGLNAGLTQILEDGSDMYLYGYGRVGEQVAFPVLILIGAILVQTAWKRWTQWVHWMPISVLTWLCGHYGYYLTYWNLDALSLEQKTPI